MRIPRGALKLIGFSPTGDLGPLTAYTSRKQGAVWFVKSPPLKAPSPWQLRQRDRFRLAAEAWRSLDENRRNSFDLAAKRARLLVCGYTLWVWWQLRRDAGAMHTIELHSGLKLI